MIYSFSAFLVLIAFVTDAEPIRFRRQQSGSMIVIPCPVQCSWSFAQAWTKAISFETPTANMIDDQFIDSRNGTFGVMCSLYSGYQQCLRACVATNVEYSNALEASPSYDEVCGQRQSDFDSYSPCLANHTRTYQRVCQKANENLLAASVRLTTPGKFDSDVAKAFCTTANEQAYCILPILRQTCGDGPYDALRTIVNATFANVRVTIGQQALDAFYPQCNDYFHTIENGIPMIVAVGNRTSVVNDTMTASIIQQGNTTVRMFNNTDATTTSSLFILRDDGNGSIYVHPTGGRLGPRLRTTTESTSSGTVKYSSNTKFVFFIFSILFSIFL